jgi:hypothetical protein
MNFYRILIIFIGHIMNNNYNLKRIKLYNQFKMKTHNQLIFQARKKMVNHK